MLRPETQLFMLMSIDGKISTGPDDNFDFDSDLPKIPGVKDGLFQYYDLEKETDEWTLCSGRTLEKSFRNVPLPKKPLDVTCVVLDNNCMSLDCIKYLSNKFKNVIVATNILKHRLCEIRIDNVMYLYYVKNDFAGLLNSLYRGHKCTKLTIQSGGTLNDLLIKAGLVDMLNIVVVPVIVGGKNTPTLVDGEGISLESELLKLKVFDLIKVDFLEDSYLNLLYKVKSDISNMSLLG